MHCNMCIRKNEIKSDCALELNFDGFKELRSAALLCIQYSGSSPTGCTISVWHYSELSWASTSREQKCLINGSRQQSVFFGKTIVHSVSSINITVNTRKMRETQCSIQILRFLIMLYVQLIKGLRCLVQRDKRFTKLKSTLRSTTSCVEIERLVGGHQRKLQNCSMVLRKVVYFFSKLSAFPVKLW